MAHRVRVSRAVSNLKWTGLKRTGQMASLMATLLLGACADTAGLLPKSSASLMDDGDGAEKKYEGTQTELQKATAYWGKEYGKRTSELKPALNYARNLKALGEKDKALAVLQQAASLHDSDPELAGEYGRLALELDQVNVAARMLQIADDPSKPDWKVVSARGTVLAKQGKYKDAIPFYERALTLAQNQPSVLNNLAMAYAMSGDAKKAEDLLRQASAGNTGQNSAKVKQNLALVLGLEGRYDEAKLLTAGTDSAVTGAENIDMVRRIVKLDPKSASTAVASTAVPDFKTTESKTPDLKTPDFKTKVTKAIATAETPSLAGSGDAYVPPPTTPSAPVFKAAVADAPATASAAWQATAAAATPAPTSGLKGSTP